MKIRVYLALIVLVPLLCGVVMNFALQGDYSIRSKSESLFSLSQLIEKDVERLVLDVRQFLLTSDLVVGNGETYLIENVYKKSELILQILKTLKESEDQSENSLGVSELQQAFVAFYAEVMRILPIISQDASAVYTLDLTDYDSLSNVVVSRLEETVRLSEKNLNYYTNSLRQAEGAVSKNFVFATSFFVVVLLITWFWAYFNISQPIQTLSAMAKNAGDGKQLDSLSVGPSEVRSLSKAFSSLANNLLYQANHDSLTGLYNRLAFNRLVKDALDNSEESTQHALCFIDLDHFKIVNDSCGHAAGDELLKQISQIITKACRPTDVIARQGGDEFSILFRDCNAQKARYLTEKIRLGIKEHQFFWLNKKYHISSSFGISGLDPKNDNIEDSFNIADLACMQAKQTGRNCIVDQRDQNVVSDRSSSNDVTFNDVKSALADDNFLLYRQSIVSSRAASGFNTHFEVLLRMKHPSADDQVLGPGAFMPVVERYRLYPELDRWVVENTLRWLKNNPDELSRINICSINLSGNSICSAEVREFIGKLFEKTPGLGKKVCFEITETEAINDFEYAKTLIQELKAYGCKFALDDFGSGLSSFSYLKHLDVDYVKIDGGFVRDLLNHEADRATVKAIVDVARAFNKYTIAEFVESKEIADALIEIGVDYFQGYYYDRPSALFSCGTLSKRSVV